MEAFNNFLDELTTELNQRGADLARMKLGNGKLKVKLQSGREIVIRNLPAVNELALYATTKVFKPATLARLIAGGRQQTEVIEVSEHRKEGLLSRILGIIIILVLVTVMIYALARIFKINLPFLPVPQSPDAGADGDEVVVGEVEVEETNMVRQVLRRNYPVK